jgi:Zn-finger nucleic acid-binding protein
VIRGFNGESIAPELGEAGIDDCPTCNGIGLDLSEADRFEEREDA